MNKWINYHHLYYFKTVAEEGSVSKAAEKLLIGQPTLSTQIKQFEDSLGLALFDRNNKKLTLTEHGLMALRYAETIFSLGSEMYEVLRGEKEPDKPYLRIGALDSIPRQVLSRLVRFARKEIPCVVHLEDGPPDFLLERLKSHKLDLVITTFLPLGDDSKGVFPKLLSKKPVAFYGAPSESQLCEGFPQSLSEYPLILPTYDSKLRYDIDKWLVDNKIKTNVIVESQDISVKKFLAMEDIGVLPAATHTVAKQVAAGELVEIGFLDGVYEELFLLAADRQIPNRVANHVYQNFSV